MHFKLGANLNEASILRLAPKLKCTVSKRVRVKVLRPEYTCDKREGFVRAAGVISHYSKGTRQRNALNPSADALAQHFARKPRAVNVPTP